MIEIAIGFLFAFLFVTAYLLVKKVLSTSEQGEPRWRELSSQALGGPKRVSAKPPQLFLPTGQMSEHHSKSKEAKGRQS